MLSRWQSTIVDAQGNIQPFAILTILNEETQAPAQIYASESESQPLPVGTVVADEFGYAYFYARGGRYRIQSAGLNIDWRHVPLGSAATRDVGTGANEVPTNDDLPTNEDLQWLGTPVGGYITPFEEPPTDDPRFRYILCTAGESGSGGYNEGVLMDETVTGTAPLVMASAVVDLAGSPMNGTSVHLINTEGRFVGAGVIEALENDMFQGHGHLATYSATPSGGNGAIISGNVTQSLGGAQVRTPINLEGHGGVRYGNRTQPRTHRLPHYRRIL